MSGKIDNCVLLRLFDGTSPLAGITVSSSSQQGYVGEDSTVPKAGSLHTLHAYLHLLVYGTSHCSVTDDACALGISNSGSSSQSVVEGTDHTQIRKRKCDSTMTSLPGIKKQRIDEKGKAKLITLDSPQCCEFLKYGDDDEYRYIRANGVDI